MQKSCWARASQPNQPGYDLTRDHSQHVQQTGSWRGCIKRPGCQDLVGRGPRPALQTRDLVLPCLCLRSREDSLEAFPSCCDANDLGRGSTGYPCLHACDPPVATSSVASRPVGKPESQRPRLVALKVDWLIGWPSFPGASLSVALRVQIAIRGCTYIKYSLLQ